MVQSRNGSLDREGVAALTLMEEALQFLDTLELSVETAAHLDLAISLLRDALSKEGILPPERKQPPFG